MLYKIRCNLIHPVYDALPEPYLPVRVTCGTAITHRTFMRLLAAETRSIAGLLSQCRRTFISFVRGPQDFYSLCQITAGFLFPLFPAELLFPSLQNDLGIALYSMVSDWHVFIKSSAKAIAQLLAPFLSPNVIPFSSFILWVAFVRLGSSD